MRSHYAPWSRAVLVEPEAVDGVLTRAGGERVVVIDTRERAGVACIRLPSDAAGYAAGLYAALRHADAMSPDLIVIVRPDASAAGVAERGAWSAVMDRLERATA
jgi:L-threonylcarbamoyladenylate synthase